MHCSSNCFSLLIIIEKGSQVISIPEKIRIDHDKGYPKSRQFAFYNSIPLTLEKSD